MEDETWFWLCKVDGMNTLDLGTLNKNKKRENSYVSFKNEGFLK